jgi:SAM-dependent methyltransferase
MRQCYLRIKPNAAYLRRLLCECYTRAMSEQVQQNPRAGLLERLTATDLRDDKQVSDILGIPDFISRGGLIANRVRIPDVEGEHDTGEEGRYLGTPYETIDHIFKVLDLQPDDVVYDLGSGFGRIPLYGGVRYPQTKFVGLELSEQRTNEAKVAARKMRLDNVTLVAGDVRNHDWSEATVFYMYKPFTAGTTHEVMYRLNFLAKQNQGKGKLKLVCKGNLNEVVSMEFWDPVRVEGDLVFYNSR